MAVFTALSQPEMAEFLKQYDVAILGNLINYTPIEKGVENSNFLITTDKNKFIATIFEQRVNKKDLPFFLELMQHLNNHGIQCPLPQQTLQQNFIAVVKNKPAAIVSFLSGCEKAIGNKADIFSVGAALAKLHLSAKNFLIYRQNHMAFLTWQKLLEKCQTAITASKTINIQQAEYQLHLSFSELKNMVMLCQEVFNNLIPIHQELYPEFFGNQQFPQKLLNHEHNCRNLPFGICHADFFPDNVFFKDAESSNISGIIDFYFACNDYWVYDLAIAASAWCFDNIGNWRKIEFFNLLRGYESVRVLTEKEKQYFGWFLLGAGLRFTLTRLHDCLFHPTDALVLPKDPKTYGAILYNLKTELLDQKIINHFLPI